jgi:putative hydrolase of HD superfamily
VDRTRCLKMALVHDLAEGLTGDFTPYDPVSKEEKHRLEEAAFLQVVEPLGAAAREEVLGLWREYEEGSSPEARVVKDLDKLEMLVQACEYERAHQVKLDEFFEGTVGRLGPLRGLGEELARGRGGDRWG